MRKRYKERWDKKEKKEERMLKKIKKLAAIILSLAMIFSLTTNISNTYAEDDGDTNYTVEYYANVEEVAIGNEAQSTTKLNVIDTTKEGNNSDKAVLPSNDSNNTTTTIGLVQSDNEYTIENKESLTKIYSDENLSFGTGFGHLEDINKLSGNDGYTLVAIWVYDSSDDTVEPQIIMNKNRTRNCKLNEPVVHRYAVKNCIETNCTII